jgi:hypothetical protein
VCLAGGIWKDPACANSASERANLMSDVCA